MEPSNYLWDGQCAGGVGRMLWSCVTGRHRSQAHNCSEKHSLKIDIEDNRSRKKLQDIMEAMLLLLWHLIFRTLFP